ncbi:hypothetical protein MAR_031925 [Mya arenaria]|uniref:Uncharacterized protein n=1 Tax=Mya arenaria TaxID=6604 RepID=A0ABY7F957_MYAAR|nr:uncharacterized protein LOC128205779 [Mya arenaria]WAR17331.1 hypothetical protein MAR_031925 [Mya arenaria]
MSFMNKQVGSFFTGQQQRGAFRKATRPVTPELIEEDDPPKKTKEQASCVANMAVLATFFLPIFLVAAGVSFGTTYWFNISPYHVGLFVRYNNWTTVSDSVSHFYSNSSITTYDEMEKTWKIGVPLLLTGGSLFVVGFLFLIFYPCHRTIGFSKIALAFIIAIILMIALIVYAAGLVQFILYAVNGHNGNTIQWSFYMCCVGAGCGLVATVFFWVHVIYQYCCDYYE